MHFDEATSQMRTVRMEDVLENVLLTMKAPAYAEDAVKETAMRLVRDELDKLRESGSREWEEFPRFVFLLLAEESKLEGLRGTIVKMLKRRLKPARKRTTHGADD